MLPNIIVPTLNQYEKLQQMVNSIDYPVKHLLIIDNGSGLDNLHVPETVQDWTVLPMPSNLGVAASWNLGIKLFSLDEYFLIVSDDVVFSPGSLEQLHEQLDSERIFVSDVFPHWQVIGLGRSVVVAAGLFDESIYPANWEDDEYEWRCKHYGITVERIGFEHLHYEHSTVRSTTEIIRRNLVTYDSNKIYFENKKAAEDYTAGKWDILRRIWNSWD